MPHREISEHQEERKHTFNLIQNFVSALKFTCNPKISARTSFTGIGGHAHGDERFVSPDTHLPSWSGKTHCVFLFQLPHCKHEAALVVYLVPCFGILVVYFSDVAVYSGPMCSAVVLSDVAEHKKPVVRLMEKMRALHRLRSGMTYTAMSPVLRNQQYVVNKVSFQRNTE